MKKRVPFFLFVLGLCVTYGSVVFSAPAFGPGEYLDPPCAPGTTYLGDDCTVSLGWEVNTTDGYVFNTTDMIGIGTSVPTATLDVRGSLANIIDNGTFTTTLGTADGFWVINSSDDTYVDIYSFIAAEDDRAIMRVGDDATGASAGINLARDIGGSGLYGVMEAKSNDATDRRYGFSFWELNNSADHYEYDPVLDLDTKGVIVSAAGGIDSFVIENIINETDYDKTGINISDGNGIRLSYLDHNGGGSPQSQLSLTNSLNWSGDSSSFNATRAVSDNDGIENVNEFTTDITTSGAVTNTTYRGLASVLTYTGDDDMSGIPAAASAPLIGILSQVESTGLGDVSLQGLLVTTSQSGDGIITGDTVGGQFVTVYSGDGSVEDFTGARFSTYNGIGVTPNSGDVDSLRGINTTTVHGSTGTTSFAYGVATNIRIENAGGLIGNAYGNDIKIIAEAGQIQQATNIKLNSLIDTGTIDNATGIEFNAGTYGGDIPGLFSTGNTIGISFQDYVAEGALEGDNVYGIYFNDSGALQGVSNEYALYIGDTNAENWFSDGLRIGTDNDFYKISANGLTNSDGSGGAIGGTGTLYIGNETIDTTFTSDERTKENINKTEYGLEELSQINIVDFNYRRSLTNDRQRHTGVLAQQVESIYPEAVSRRSDGYLMVDYKTFIPLTIQSIQELDIKVSDIEIMANETFVSRLRDWLASATNGIERIFAGRVETNEIQTDQLCVGSRCISESEFIELLDRNSVSGTPATGDSDEIDSGIEEEITESESENEALLEEGSDISSEEEVTEIESEDNVPLELVEEESDTSPGSEEEIDSLEPQEEEVAEESPVEEESNDASPEESGGGESSEPVSE